MSVGSSSNTLPVDDTLRWVAAGYRTLVWIWMLILVLVVGTGSSPGNRLVLVAGMALATIWLGVSLWAAQSNSRLGNPYFAVLDGVVALALSGVGLAAGTSDFVTGGWPGSWLFMVAFAANLRWTLLAGVALVLSHTLLHILHGLPIVRTAGTFQFITLALVIGWAFDNLRHREKLRLEAELALAHERETTARHEERSRLAVQLHDSVLQSLHAIKVGSDDSNQVRYLARRQERELRRTIEEFRSPYANSFKARLLQHRDEVEDLCRNLQIVEVIRDDRPMTSELEAALSAAREAMMNAAKHAGVSRVDLYSEIDAGEATIYVRDRGVGFSMSDSTPRGLRMALSEPVGAVGGFVEIESRPGEGTEVKITVPCE